VECDFLIGVFGIWEIACSFQLQEPYFSLSACRQQGSWQDILE
jgi:hypothetical protein